MSVIAWDGKSLAGDRRATASGLPYSIQKVFCIGDVIFGVTGGGSDAPLFRVWVEGGMNVAEYPKVSDTFAAIVIKNGDCYRYEQGGEPMPLAEPFHAVGCGRDLAIAAMHCGRSAKEAVEIACTYDVFCGNGVDVFEATKR